MTPVVAIVGPTGVGKTALALAVAAHLGGGARCAMLVADSRQVLRGLRVGTCTPTDAELAGVPCHLRDLCEPGERFTVAEWRDAAVRCLDELAERGITALLVGGTGLYVEAALDGLALPGGAPDPARRTERDRCAATAAGLRMLVDELERRDPAGAATVDLRNPRRVVRALELVDACGSVAAARRRQPGRSALRLGLDAPRPLHERLVQERAGRLLLSGALLREVEWALDRGIGPAALERAGIGYREALDVLAGRVSAADGVEALVRRTMRYAKAQRTWFRRDRAVRWLTRETAAVEPLAAEIVDALHEDAGAGERLHRRHRR